MDTIFVKKLSPSAKLPTKSSPSAAGFDLCSLSRATILPGKRVVIDTGLMMMIPEGFYGRLAMRSGLCVKYGLCIGAGVIDSDYRGEVKAVIFNLGETSYTINAGDRVVQLVLEKLGNGEIQEVEDLSKDTQRGDGGFGSSGI